MTICDYCGFDKPDEEVNIMYIINLGRREIDYKADICNMCVEGITVDKPDGGD